MFQKLLGLASFVVCLFAIAFWMLLSFDSSIDITKFDNLSTDKEIYFDRSTMKYVTVPVNDSVSLKVIESGNRDNPLMVFLHGFPQTALHSWYHQIKHFSKNYYVLAPDMRGYNESSKPSNIHDYHMMHLANDVKHLITQYAKKDNAVLVSHDWGGAVAWYFCVVYPQLVSKHIAMNIPHPSAMTSLPLIPQLKQLLSSWYIIYFQFENSSEKLIRENDFGAILRAYVKFGENGKIGRKYISEYRKAFAQPNALRSMMNYYRSLIRCKLNEIVHKLVSSDVVLKYIPFVEKDRNSISASLYPKGVNLIVDVPTMILWGAKDKFLTKDTAALSFDKFLTEKAKQKSKIHYFENASHWLTLEHPKEINEMMDAFLKQQ